MAADDRIATVLLAGIHARQARRETSEPAPPLQQRLGPAGAALVVSAAGDPTACHFFATCRRADRAVTWITTGDICDGRVSIAGFTEMCRAAGGVYRRALGEDPAEVTARAEIRAATLRSRNLVACPPTSTNWSKPLHVARMAAVLQPFGGRVPDTRIGRRPAPGRLVKPMSAHPGYALAVGADPAPEAFLVMAQVRAAGLEKRVHLVDDACFVHAIRHAAVDYRTDAATRIERSSLAPRWQAACRALARAEGLRLAGIDLIEDGDDITFIEVNPMPGYDGFERASPEDTSITLALFNLLGGSDEIPVRSERHQGFRRGDAHPHPARAGG